MGLTYNGIAPLTITFDDGVDLTTLKYGNTYVWAKAYTLSIDAGSNTTVTVNRTSSQFQHASTGTLSNGSIIYYGDMLTVSYTVSSGYAIATHTLNGTTFTSGTSHAVTGNVTVVTTAQASASWHTVWSGNKYMSSTGSTGISIQRNTTTRVTFNVWGIFEGDGLQYGYDTATLTNGGATTGTSYAYSEEWQIYFGFNWRFTISSAGKLTLSTFNYECDSGSGQLTITKVEQYY